MKNPFKKEVVDYKAEEPSTPYQRARQEWDMRLGAAYVSARNWRLVSLLSLLVIILVLMILGLVLTNCKDKVYIAEVTKEGRIVNVAPILVHYQPSEAQKEYFVCRFIELIDGMTLDPVAVRQNWLTAYKFLSGSGIERLNTYFKKNNPVALVGKKTITVQVLDINPVSSSTIHVDWVENIINTNGEEEGKRSYSGVFTVAEKQPITREEILRNPLGIYIVDFSISPK